MARGAKVRSKNPPIPLAPSQFVVMLTRDLSPCGATSYVVTRLDPVSVSTSVRPGVGSLTCHGTRSNAVALPDAPPPAVDGYAACGSRPLHIPLSVCVQPVGSAG